MELESVILHLRTHGWYVLEDVIPREKVDGVRKSVQVTVASSGRPSAVKGVGFIPGLINRNQSIAPYLADRRLLDPIEALLGTGVRISFTSGIINYPANPRGGWHADWPFNQDTAAHIPVPYPDAVMHITTLWMLSAFSAESGGTFIVPGSHRANTNPTGSNGIDPRKPHLASGSAGSVLIMDSRLWHATAPNSTDQSRAAVAVRYAPWWLNLNVLMPDSPERIRMMEETGKDENLVPPVPRAVYEGLPPDVKPLFRHWVGD